MNLVENFKMALKSIASNRMRSFLTMLGIIIGISSVIMIISVGDGGKASIMGQLNDIGAASVQIKVDTQNATSDDYITLSDVNAVRRSLPFVRYASVALQKQGTAASSSQSKQAVVLCVNQDYAALDGLTLLSGRFFTEREVDSDASVAVVDNNTALTLFGTLDCTGRTLNVNVKNARYKARVVGVIKSELGVFGNGKNMPAMVYLPVTTVLANADASDTQISSFYIMADNKDNTDTAGNAAVRMLEARHGNRSRDLYSYQNMIQQVAQINNVINIFTEFISAVAAISLLVGGIGVMNIMLVAVTERTREIGIRKSLGAKTRVIMLQFLTESVIITLIGGLAGIILGLLGARGIGSLVGVTPVLSPGAFAVAILFSCAVGIFFGIYPARKAARLNPIEALRHD